MLTVGERARVGELRDRLGTLREGDGRVLEGLMPGLRDLLHAERSCAYGLSVVNDRQRSEYLVFDDPAVVRAVRGPFDRLLGRVATNWGLYNPLRPEEPQRNRVLTVGQVARSVGRDCSPVSDEIWPLAGVAGCDQIRVLLCDGPVLVAWVGGFRREPFGARERRVLSALREPLLRRLTLERRLESSTLDGAALEVALEAIPAAAFVVGAGGGVRHANAAGRALFDGDRASIATALVPRARDGMFEFTPIAAPGRPLHYLAIARPGARDTDRRVAAVAHRWSLTAKQTRVLRCLADGAANKTICALLDCAENTVEAHVTALLHKAQVENRAALIARFWKET